MKKIGAKVFVNFITSLRVIGTFLMPLVCSNMTSSEVIIYLTFLLLTDAIDGFMARKLNVSTIFGALLDAFADKLLGIAIFALLASVYPIMLVPIITEALIMLINTGGATKGASVESSKLGKSKTVIIGFAMVFSFLIIYSSDIISLINPNNMIGKEIINIFNILSKYSNGIINSLAFVCVGADLMVAYDYHNRVKNDVEKAKNNGLDAKEYKLKKGKELLFALFDEEYYKNTLDEPLLKRLGEVREGKNERKNKRK